MHTEYYSTSATVEIIPGDGNEWLPEGTEPHKRFLLVDQNLGVPHKVLYQAYLEAVAAFRRTRVALLSNTIQSEDAASDYNNLAPDLLNTSAVLLLLNPGHNTAWNVRKKLVLSGHHNADQELSFTTALLTVRDCAKQSLLWHHRRWLLRKIYPISGAEKLSLLSWSESLSGVETADGGDEDTLRCADITLQVLENEFSACIVGCTTYERNYFGWSHRFRCLDALASMIHKAMLVSDPQAAQSLDLLGVEFSRSSLWIDQHVSDYTAMQYHCRVDSVLQQYLRPSVKTINTRSLPPSASNQAQSLLMSYPSHEALWLYLRYAAASRLRSDSDTVSRLTEFAVGFQASEDRGTSIGTSADLAQAEGHARRLLKWLTRTTS
jgi:protein prenyltransferase alpha subunit repeat containing protein 1